MGIYRNFPYSNFHEMNMDEIIKIIKDMLEEWATYHAEWDSWMDQMNDDWSNYQDVMNEAWENMQNFINNYFDNLDLQEEVNAKIVSMIQSGEFGLLVNEYIPTSVNAWLNNNITEPEGVVIDSSLTISGACADAKVTGDALSIVTDLTTLYDGLNANNTGTGGVQYAYRLYHTVIKHNSVCRFVIKVQSACTFHIAFAETETGKVVSVYDYSFSSGDNVVDIKNDNADCYPILSAEVSTLKYGDDSDALIGYHEINTGAYLVVDDVISNYWSESARNSFSFSCTIRQEKQIEYEETNDDQIIYDEKIIYSGLDKTNTGSGGLTYNYYLTNAVVYAHTQCILKIKIKSNCIYRIALADSNSGEIVYTTSLVFSPGIHECTIDYIPDSNCYLVIGAEANTIYYGSDATAPLKYKSINTGAYLSVGDNINVTNISNVASFAMDIKLILVNLLSNPLINKIIFLAGDSRSSTDYTFYGEQIEGKTGGTAIVGGASGQTAAYIASNTYFQNLIDNPHDFSIWLVGGNDTGKAGTVGTFSATSVLGKEGEEVVTETNINNNYDGTKFIQAIDHMIRKYKALFYDWKTLNNGHKPRMIMCTDLPQKRQGSVDFSSPANWERKRQAIIEACEKNGMPYLDLFKLCNFDMAYEPEYVPPTDKFTNNGLYYMDGLHPNMYGMDLVTSIELQELLRFVQTI